MANNKKGSMKKPDLKFSGIKRNPNKMRKQRNITSIKKDVEYNFYIFFYKYYKIFVSG